MVDVNEVLKALEKRRIKATYFPEAEAAVKYIVKSIPAGSTVGIGGSVTVAQLGLPELLTSRGCRIYCHWSAAPEKVMEHRLISQRCDFYLCSSNAITRDGRLVNTDGTGDRVGAMIFGPGKVLIVAGINKLVQGLDEAIARIKEVAVPQNARRRSVNTPCAITGKCHDCSPPQRMCNVTVIIEGLPRSSNIEVIIVGEELGY